MTDQCCGTCRFYEPEPHPDDLGAYGRCTWTFGRAVPPHLEDGDWEVYSTDNRSCRVWLAKETQDVA